MFHRILGGEVPGGRRLRRKKPDGSVTHRPGRDVTRSAPKSVSLMAMVDGNERIVEAHDKAASATLGWIKVRATAPKAERGLLGPDLFAGLGYAAGVAAAWAVGHLSERQSVFGHADLLAAILAGTDRVVGVRGYAGTGKTTMLKRLRALGESRGYRTIGLAPSASAAKTLATEPGIRSETLQRFLARHDGIAQGRGAADRLHKLRASKQLSRHARRPVRALP